MAQKPYYAPVDDELQALLKSQGLEPLGVAAAQSAPEEEGRYRRWLEEGFAGQMSFLWSHAEAKFHPERVLPGVRSVIFVGLNYYQKPLDPGPDKGRVALYAWGRDYHRIFQTRLRKVLATLRSQYPDDQFRAFSDAGPLAERYYAEQAGAGFTGRHTLLINGSYGSYLLLGEILSTRAYPPTPALDKPHGACPGGCRKCLDICPTGALKEAYRLDARRCISYLTIEHRGPIDDELKPLMGAWVLGCDLCQYVCPLNLRAQVTAEPDFKAWRAGPGVDLASLLDLKDEDMAARWAGTPLMRPGRVGLVRNAAIAAANTGRTELIPRLQNLRSDPDPGIADAARWALERLT